MGVSATKSGGIYIEIAGDYSKLQADLRAVAKIGKDAGEEISKSLSGALSPNQIARSATQVTSYMQKAQAAAKALKADLSQHDKTFRDMGRAIGVAEKDLTKFARTQQEALKARLVKEYESNVKKLNAALGQTSKEARGASSAFDGFTGKILGLVSAYKVFDSAKQAFTNAAQFETMGVALQNVGQQAGYSELKLQSYENQLRKLGIAGIETRQSLTQLIQAQIGLEQAPGLARIAQDAAVIGRINSSEAFSRMIQGIQSSQVEILRNIGISVNFQQAYKNMAKELGVTVEQLSESEKAQARVNAVMEAGTHIAGTYEASLDTVGKQLSSLQRIWNDFLTDTGRFFTDNGFIQVLSGTIEEFSKIILLQQLNMEDIGFEDASRAYKQTAADMREMLEAVRFVKDNLDGTLGTVHNVAQAVADSLNPAIRDGAGGFEDAHKALTEYTKGSKSAQKAAQDLAYDQAQTNVKMLESRIEMQKTAAEAYELAAGMLSFSGAFGSLIGNVQAAALQSNAQAAREEIESLTKDVQTYTARIDEVRNAQLKGGGRGGQGGASALDSARKSAEQLYAQLTMSREEYERFQKELQFSGWAKAGLSIEEIDKVRQAWKNAQQEAKFTEASRALQDFEKDYQATLGNIAGAMDSVRTEMDIFRQAAENQYGNAPERAEEYRQILGRITELEQRRMLYVSQDATAGLQRSIIEYEESARNAAENTSKFFSSAMSSVEDLVSDSLANMRLDLSSLADFAKSIAADMARMFTRQFITAPLFSAIGGAFFPSAHGNVFASNPAGISAYSNSIVSTPTIFPFAKGVGLMGEAGAEAIMPLVRTSSGDLGVRAEGSSGGGDVAVYQTFNNEFNINSNSPDTGAEISQTVMNQLSNQMTKSIKGLVLQTILEEQRPGGALNAGIR